MGVHKKDQFTKQQLDSARIGVAISSPARVAIIQHINQFGTVTNKELIRKLELSGTAVHQHLQMLIRSGIISENYFENKHYYYFPVVAKKDLQKIEWLLI